MRENIKKTSLFVGLTFFVNWSLALLFVALGGRWQSPIGAAFGAAYMFVPMAVAILIQKRIYGQPVAGPLGISFRLNRWFLIAWLLPPAVAFATLGIGLLLPGVEYSPQMEGLFDRYASMLTPDQTQKLREQIAAMPIGTFWLGLLQGIFTTTSSLEGHRITQYHGVVNGEAILGADIFEDIMAYGQRQRHGCHNRVTVPARLGVRWLLRH